MSETEAKHGAALSRKGTLRRMPGPNRCTGAYGKEPPFFDGSN